MNSLSAHVEGSDAGSLMSAAAVRERCHRLLRIGTADGLDHFAINLDRLGVAGDVVLGTMREAYPSLDVPFHSRWRHFRAGGEDRWGRLAGSGEWKDPDERARAAFDLAIVSVLLDAGAGPAWRYRDPVSGETFGRSEGLALASLEMFSRGEFSESSRDPLRVDATALIRMSAETLAHAMQVSEVNRLVGLVERAELLRRLGAAVLGAPNVFARADEPRPGGLFDHLAGIADGNGLKAATILREILDHLGSIWPSPFVLHGVALGDCWRHPAISTRDVTDGLVPFHKLSQWLSYSLIEPLEAAGVPVVDIDGLTGLAEYRNGGLFVDTEVLRLRDPADAEREHDVGSTLVVEWRALTVALLDRLADGLRRQLRVNADELPLAKVLEGGTWSAGRRLAAERRADGSPPIRVKSNGTVF